MKYTKAHDKAKLLADRLAAETIGASAVRSMPLLLRWLVRCHVLRTRMRFSTFFLTAWVGRLVFWFYRRGVKQ